MGLSPDRVIGTGTRHDSRPRHQVLCDARLNQLLEEDSGISSVGGALDQGSFEDELRSDRIYFVEKDVYHTCQNVTPDNAYKVRAGPEDKGHAGDIDVGYLDLNTREIRNIELKSNGTLPPVGSIGEDDRTPGCVKEGRDTNGYIARLLKNFAENDNFRVPYNPSVEVWNGVVNSRRDLSGVPEYTSYGGVIASDEALERAEDMVWVGELDDGVFNGWLFGGGEVIKEDELVEGY